MAKVTNRSSSVNVTLETGEIARRASGAVMVSMGAPWCSSPWSLPAKRARPGLLPPASTTSKFYSAGPHPRRLLQREGRPTEKGLTSRLIDRPVRPLFPEEFRNEVQVIAQVVSLDPRNRRRHPGHAGRIRGPEPRAIPSAAPSAPPASVTPTASTCSIPSATELGPPRARPGRCRHGGAVLMVESEAKLLSGHVMLGAVMFGHKQMQVAIKAIAKARHAGGQTVLGLAGAPARSAAWCPRSRPPWATRLAQASRCATSCSVATPSPRSSRRQGSLKGAEITEQQGWNGGSRQAFAELRYRTLRDAAQDQVRIDGRQLDDIRPISVRVGVLPRTHGSPFSPRRNAGPGGHHAGHHARRADHRRAGRRSEDPFLFHYNFPPFSVGGGQPLRRALSAAGSATAALWPAAACRR